MKILLFTDTHFSNKNDNNNEILKDFFMSMINYCNDNNIDTAIFAGDANEVKKLINIKTFNACFKCFNLFRQNNIELYGIAGNHDIVTLNDNQYSIQSFKTIMNLYVKPKSKILDDKSFLFLPFGFDIDDYYDNQDYIICHNDILNMSFSKDKTINPKKYKNSFLICGHLHERKEFDNGVIIGSPIYHSFADNPNNAKGFYILDTTNNKLKFIEFTSPKYIKLKADTENEYAEIIKTIENDTQNHYQIVVNFNKKLSNTENIDIKYNIETQDDIKLNLSSDLNDNITSYLQQSEIKLDKDKIKSIIDCYMKEIR